jgi:hypothetical protein
MVSVYDVITKHEGVGGALTVGGTIKEMFMLAREFDPADVGRIRLSKDEKLRVAVGYLWRQWQEGDWMGWHRPGPTPKARTRKPRGPGGASGGDSRMDAGTVLHWPVQVVQVVQQFETGETV